MRENNALHLEVAACTCHSIPRNWGLPVTLPSPKVPCNHKGKVQLHISSLYEGGTQVKPGVHCFKHGHMHDCPTIWNHHSWFLFLFAFTSSDWGEKVGSNLDISLRSLCCMRTILSKVTCGGYTQNYVCAASFRRELGLSYQMQKLLMTQLWVRAKYWSTMLWFPGKWKMNLEANTLNLWRHTI